MIISHDFIHKVRLRHLLLIVTMSNELVYG